MKKAILSIMLLAGIYGLAFGQQESKSHSSSANEQWEKIGEKKVDLSMDRGIFDWNTDREKKINADEKYSAIKFKAKDASVNLTNVQVLYEDGKKQDLSLNGPVQVNKESKAVKLDGKEKLDKITFNFRKDETGKADKASIEVWGLKAGTGSGMGQGVDVDVDVDKK